MSSRLAKSTNKFRPVKPQQKKVASGSTGTSTPAGSPAPAPLPSTTAPSSLSSATPHDGAGIDISSSSAPSLATTNATAEPAVTSSSIGPPALPPSQPSSIPQSRSSTPIQLTVPSAPPLLSSSQQPRSLTPIVATASSSSTETRDENTQPRQIASAIAAPTSTSSRQGTPIASSIIAPGSSFISQSWQDLEATQVEIPSSTPIPDTQQTLVSDSTQEPSDKDAGKTIAPGLEPSLELIAGAPNADQQNTHMSNEATSVEPASLAILISEAVTSTRTADPSPDLQSSAPPLASLPPLPVPLPPLPPRYANEDVDQQRGTESGEGEDIPVPEEGLSTAANVEPVSAEQAAPKGKKRGRPPGSKNTKDASASKKAKTNKKEATSKKSSKRKKKMIAGGGAELGSDNEAEPDNVLDNPEGEDVDVEAAIAQAVARAGVPTQATPSREGTEGAEGTSEGQAGDETAALNGTTRKPTTKRKAPYKSKKKKKKARRASTIGEDEEGEEEDSDEEVDEDGNPIIIPWEIKKIRPGYSLSTDDIYAAIGVDPPASFEFMTGQDEVEVYEDEQEEEHVEEEEENGDETMRQEDEEDGEERQNEGEVIDGEDGLPGNTSASIPWLPFKGPIDPTITTMRQLTEDTGRGRMASKGSSSFTEKIDRKQRLKLARETMKLRTKLIRSGIKPEAVDRVLNEKSEELFSSNNGNNGTVIVEFDVGDQLNAPSGMASQGVNGHDAASRRGTPLASTSGNQQPLFRPEDDSGEDEDAQSGHQDSDEDENDNEQQDGQEEEEGFDDIVESRYAPQMKVVNGELVLDENSTQVVLENPDRESYATVEDHPDGRKVNSYTYSKRGKASRWTLADTDLFYEGLTQFGTDFELISRMFSNRTRRQIKAKFVREEKLDPNRIEESLSGKKKIDINFYERMTKLDFRNGIVPADPMAKFYEDLPTLSNAVKLESNRQEQQEDGGPEIDLVALLRKKKEDTAGLGNAWDNSRPGPYHGIDEGAIPEEEEQEGGVEEPNNYEVEHDDDDEEPEYVEAEEQTTEREMYYRSPSPVEEEPFTFSGGVQLRVSG